MRLEIFFIGAYKVLYPSPLDGPFSFSSLKKLVLLKPTLLTLLPSLAVAFVFCFHCSLAPRKQLVIDPGHGGAGIVINEKVVKSDRWDPVSRHYRSHYMGGMEADGYKEHLVVLELARRLKYYLDLTTSFWGWWEFEKILRKFSNRVDFPRIIIDAKLTRRDSWNHHYQRPDKLAVNNDYRLYDYPDQRGRLRPSRLSFINYHHPSLVVSLHMNPAGAGNDGGMAAVLAPGFKSYDMIRRIHLKQEGLDNWERSPWYGKILATEEGWSQFELMRADSWVYLHGYRSNRQGTQPNFNAFRGIRHNLVSWAYKEDGWEKWYRPKQPGPYALNYADFRARGKFWDRERSQAEQWRREGGRLGYGGDNHYAADELMRFVQYGVRLLRPHMRADEKIGPILPPFVSAYTLPIYVNAVVAFLEIGHLNRRRDRYLVIEEREAVAQSLAVGIYSLYCGIPLRLLPENPYPPQAQPLDFEKYYELPAGDYFKAAVP